MRFFTLSLVASTALVSLSPAAHADEGEVRAVSAVSVFVPVGFDDNDEAELVLDGYYPSGCYKQTDPKIAVDSASRHITVTPQARYFDAPCVEARVPYFQVVNLGVLAKGDYGVTVQNAGDVALAEALTVVEATTQAVDDFIYAPVDAVKVAQRPDGSVAATIEGRFTSTCMTIDHIKVVSYGKVVTAQPLMRISDEDCVMTEVKFSRTVTLPTDLVPGRHLLHVRSLSGQAMNTLFTKNRP